MNQDAVHEALGTVFPKERIRKNEPMKNHTAFKIGGPADLMLLAVDADEVGRALRVLHEIGTPCFVMGNGSNLLVSDQGYRGVILKIGEGFDTIVIEGSRIRAGAGALVSSLSKQAAKASLSGLEFASGIPGTLGGAVAMNAGAYGGEMKDVVREVLAVDRSGKMTTLSGEALAFGYRSSRIQREDLVVLEVAMELSPGGRQEIAARMNELNRRRSDKQPLHLPSAGSTFKRPEGHYAGKLIEDAGLKGLRHGDAMVSDKHSGFIVNMGEATAEEVLALIRTVQKVVLDTFGVRLETEVKIIGEY